MSEPAKNAEEVERVEDEGQRRVAKKRSNDGRTDEEWLPPPKKSETTIVEIVTHDGNFHGDDVLACAMLKMLFSSAEIVRTRDPSKTCAEPGRIVVDVGGKYDPSLNLFDHHHLASTELLYFEEAGYRSKTPMAAAGLVFREFGARILEIFVKRMPPEEETQNVAPVPSILGMKELKRADWGTEEELSLPSLLRRVYSTLVQEVDAVDNGIFPPRLVQVGRLGADDELVVAVSGAFIMHSNMSSIVSSCNYLPGMDKRAQFDRALEICRLLFEAHVLGTIGRINTNREQTVLVSPDPVLRAAAYFPHKREISFVRSVPFHLYKKGDLFYVRVLQGKLPPPAPSRLGAIDMHANKFLAWTRSQEAFSEYLRDELGVACAFDYANALNCYSPTVGLGH